MNDRPHGATCAGSAYVDVVVIGGGQAGLAIGYFLLRRSILSFAVLDANPCPGGSWQHMWDSLHAFSPARYCSLPGWAMPAVDGNPDRDQVVHYLRSYEQRYQLPVHRPVTARSLTPTEDGLRVSTSTGDWHARAVVSATGTWTHPFWPTVPGQHHFAGRQLHAADYRNPGRFSGQTVAVIGGGNSAAQILADLHPHAETLWAVRRPPRFLPDDVDGRALFEIATARWRARQTGQPDPGGVGGLGDIVMVPAVRAAREAGALHAQPMFSQLTAHGARWPDGSIRHLDAIIWCTGFRPALTHLASLQLHQPEGHICTDGTRCLDQPRLWMVGYGDWTGDASATLVGVGRTARDTVAQINTTLSR